MLLNFSFFFKERAFYVRPKGDAIAAKKGGADHVFLQQQLLMMRADIKKRGLSPDYA